MAVNTTILADSFYPEYPALITVPQLIAILGIGRNRAYELLNSGEIRAVHVGKKHMIPKFRFSATLFYSIVSRLL